MLIRAWTFLPASGTGRLADILTVMQSPSLPAAFAPLLEERNPAADSALVEALPFLEPFVQRAALEILLQRDNPTALADLVGRFNDYGDELQQLLAAHVNGLSAGVRIAVSSPSLQFRASAIELIVRGDADRLAYLLADALRSRCRRTRKLAARGLHRMTAHLLDRLEARPPAATLEELNERADRLAEALGTSVRHWEIHLQSKVLEAALWLGDRTGPAIFKKLREASAAPSGRRETARAKARGSALSDALEALIAGTSEPRLAGFVLRALAVPELRAIAAGAIGRSQDADFVRAVMMESRLLDDPRIEQACQWIRDDRWLHTAVNVLYTLDDSTAARGVRLLSAIGGPQQRKAKVFRELIGFGRDDIRRAVVQCLVNDKTETSTGLLTAVAARSDDSAARLAAREVRRRRGHSQPRTLPGLAAAAPESATHEDFDWYWGRFHDLHPQARRVEGDAIPRGMPHAGIVLRARLASSDALDRLGALRMAASLGWVKLLEEPLYHAASDPDPIVRSTAVAMLAELPGPTAERLLRTAVNDQDERVQANAVEAFDRLAAADRVSYIMPKLKSTDGRVRAAAIRSLLCAGMRQAGDVLLDMLEDSSPAHRLAALWVVESLRLRSLLHRIENISRADADPRVRRRAELVCSALVRTDMTDAEPPMPGTQDARGVPVKGAP